jgi:hypothetical protein
MMANDGADSLQLAKRSLLRYAALGAFWCSAGMFLVSPLVALLYQFPIIFNGKVVGIEVLMNHGVNEYLEVIPEVWFTLFIFGLMGGLPATAVLGGVVGALSRQWFGVADRRLYWKTLGAVLFADLLVATALALAADLLAPSLVLRS